MRHGEEPGASVALFALGNLYTVRLVFGGKIEESARNSGIGTETEPKR